MQFESFDVFT